MASWKKILVEGDAATDNIGSADQTVSGDRDLDLGTNTFTITAGSPGAGENQQGLSMAEDSPFRITSPTVNIRSGSVSSPGELRIEGVLGYYVGLKANAADTSNTVYTLPNGSQNAPTTGDCLISSSTGALSWSGRLEKVNPSATGALTINNVVDGNQGQARLQIEDYSGGQYVSLDAPNSVSSNYTITLPAAAPTAANQILESDASGNLSWITTPSGGGVTINNNTDNYLITASGTADTLNGESNLTFNGNTLVVTGRVEPTDNIRITTNNKALFGVTTGSANRSLAKVNTSDSVEIGDSSSKLELKGASVDGGSLDFSIGKSNLDSITASAVSLSTDGAYGEGAEITYYDTSAANATTAGRVYYYTGSQWSYASPSTEAAQKALLGIAVGSDESKGFLLRGYVNVGTITAGTQQFIASNASVTSTAPTTSGHFQRILGHSISTSVMYFNPSQEYIEIA